MTANSTLSGLHYPGRHGEFWCITKDKEWHYLGVSIIDSLAYVSEFNHSFISFIQNPDKRFTSSTIYFETVENNDIPYGSYSILLVK